MALIKGKVKYTTINNKGEKHNITATICGRTPEELQGRMEKYIDRTARRAEWSGLQFILRG